MRPVVFTIGKDPFVSLSIEFEFNIIFQISRRRCRDDEESHQPDGTSRNGTIGRT